MNSNTQINLMLLATWAAIGGIVIAILHKGGSGEAVGFSLSLLLGLL